MLLDTNVVSELVKPKPDRKVVRFVREAVDPWLCAITLHELVYGAERSPDAKRRAKLLAWIAQVTAEFDGRTIAVDNAVAERSGRLRALAVTQGRPATVVDALIAASAQLHGLRLATRNTKDFKPFGIAVVNPWLE
ncbi:MAG: type II toxin-antitoxin system VapC family toxin [Propylenella sp.]